MYHDGFPSFLDNCSFLICRVFGIVAHISPCTEPYRKVSRAQDRGGEQLVRVLLRCCQAGKLYCTHTDTPRYIWYTLPFQHVLRCAQDIATKRIRVAIGPIVRITPTELHIRDPEYYDVLYTRGSARRNKYAYFAGGFGFASDTFNTEDHDHHRMRRKAIAPFFSVARINDFQSTIHAKINKLCKILESQYADNDVVALLDRAWTALTTDIITEYAFARSYNHLDNLGFQETMHESLIAIYSITKLAMQFPIVFTVLDNLPGFIVRRFKPDIMPVVGLRRDLAKEIRAIRANINDQNHESTSQPTIFRELLSNQELPSSEKTDDRLGDEAQLIVAAGLVTTSWALSIATFYLSRDRSILRCLREEVQKSRLAEPFDWNRLVQLPYLNGIVHESIRLSHGTATRHPRRAPDTDLVYLQWNIPRNTPVSMTTIDVMMDPDIFLEPETFDPERWVRHGADLERYFVPFGKGSRQCLGIK